MLESCVCTYNAGTNILKLKTTEENSRMRFLWRVVLSCCWMLMILTVFGRLLSPRNAREIELHIPDVSFNQSMGVKWQMVIDQRNYILNAACKNKTYWGSTHVSKSLLDHIVVWDRHKTLFCQTSDVGDNEWKKLIVGRSGAFSDVNDQEKDNLRRLSSMNSKEIKHRLENYFKFLIVRDPFERLISTFEDKFLFNKPSEPWYKYIIGPAIIRKYRKGLPYLNDIGLLFDEFVRYLGDLEGQKSIDWVFGHHIINWAPYVELCIPCDIHYDFVGHLETLELDAPHILSRAGIAQQVRYPTISPGILLYNKTKVQRYFSGISKWDIRSLYARYQRDFESFGYPAPEFLFN